MFLKYQSVTQLYRDMIDASEPIHSFTIKDDEDSFLIWTILKHTGIYIGTIRMIFVLCIDVYCLRFLIGLSPIGMTLIPQSLHDML